MSESLIVVFALCAVAGSILQSVVLFKCTLAATSQIRQDYLDVLLTQKQSFEQTLQYARDTQSIGGTPLQFALAQHESQCSMASDDAKRNYELAKMDVEMRRQLAPKRPAVVQSRDAMGS